MRLSTNTIYSRGISTIQSIQSDQVKLQNQLSTGKRFSSPQEDPIAAARALEIKTNMKVNDDFAYVRKTAESNLTILEGNLSGVTDHLLAAKSKIISAGNGSLSDNERNFIAADLQSTLDGLVGLANAQDASGKYMYAGFKPDTKPFELNGGNGLYDFNGDSSNHINIDVGSNTTMAINAAGDEVFQNGMDTFGALQDMITLLKTPITDAATQATFTAGVATGIDNLTSSLNNVLNVRASVGGRLNQLESLDTAGSALDVQYQTSLSDIQDLDYASALSEFTKTQTMLEAAQKTFSSTAKLSLFDYM
jgi:flagellar hook-associated protein 3 FlgL